MPRIRATLRLLALVTGLLTLALVGPPAAASAHSDGFSVSVFGRTVTRPLASNFLGLALEYSTIPEWTAQSGQASNQALTGLVRGLDPSGRPSLRIGGQSTDRSWWPIAGVRRPVGVTYSLGSAWIRSARELVTGTDAQLMLGVNLEADSSRIAHVEADQLVGGVGASNVSSLQIGNEPNLYLTTPWYRVQDGHVVPWYAKTGTRMYARASSWDPAAFDAQFAQFARVLPNLPLAGPETNPGPWLDSFDGLLSPHSRVRTLTTHAYGLNNCVTNPDGPLYPSVPHLLSLVASRDMFTGIGPSLARAHRDGAGFRIDEMGSITCNGKPGVSDTFASALWAMDALFDADRLGIDGVNLHSFPDSDNGLFDFTYESSAKQWRASVHPLYDGALMFAQAAPAGSQLLHIASGPQTELRAWATRAPDHRVRVLLINDDTSASAAVRVGVPAGYGTAPGTIERLSAPSASATGGVTLGGHPFSSTTTGVAPAPVLTSVQPRNGVALVSVPAASAALLTLSPSAGASSLLPVGVVDPVHLRTQLLANRLDLVAGLF